MRQGLTLSILARPSKNLFLLSVTVGDFSGPGSKQQAPSHASKQGYKTFPSAFHGSTPPSLDPLSPLMNA